MWKIQLVKICMSYRRISSTHWRVDISRLRGQAFDGAANMSGKFNGVAAKFREEEPRALYVHSHAHLLDLAVATAIL